MKTIFTAALFFSLIASYTNVFASPISRQELDSYKNAVRVALSQSDLYCEESSADFIKSSQLSSTLDQATSASMEKTNNKFILTFTWIDGDTKLDMQVTSLTDLKNIESMSFIESSKINVNKGNLENPIISSEYKQHASKWCN